jgi:DNA-binding LacI/PurR family transcriptional regulator
MSQGSGVDGRPRMVDVGRLASVSAQTVSRYFTGGYVGPDTRARIERAVAELGYRPNAAARRLKSNRAEAIGMLAIGHPNFGIWSILDGMTAGARAAGFTLVIGQLDIVVSDPESPHEITTAIDQLLRSGVDGVVMATPYAGSEELLGNLLAETPSIVISERPESADNSIGTDSLAGGMLAMEHLIDLGHRRILHVAGDPATIEGVQREAAYREVLSRHRLEPLPVSWRDWTADGGYEVGRAIDPDAFTAVFAGNDLIASGFMSALRERGLHAPVDYAIAAIDDMPESRFAAPPLTSVDLGFRWLGQTAVEMLLERIATGENVRHRRFTPLLRVRESTAQVAG